MWTPWSKHVDAVVKARGRTDSVNVLSAPGASECYMARMSATGKRGLKSGARYPFTLVIDGGTATQSSGRAVLRQFANLSRMRALTDRQLDCP